MQAARARRYIDATNELGEVFALEIGQQDADYSGTPRHEGLRTAVRYVLKPRRHLKHALANLFGHPPGAIERARYGGHGNVRLPGDIFQSRAHTCLGSTWTA